MASNITLGYHQLRESKRHNQVTESETYRHNLVTEDQGQQDIDQRLNIANADRQSRENIAALDRQSRERVADQDRTSRENVAQLDRDARKDIADRDRTSKQLIASQDRMTNLARTQAEINSRAQLQDDQQRFSDEQRRYANIYNASGFDPNNTLVQNMLTMGYKMSDNLRQLMPNLGDVAKLLGAVL